MLGSYYATRALSPIHGLGDLASEAAAALETMLGGQKAFAAIPWAVEDEGKWEAQSLPENRYDLYPVTAQMLDAVKTATFGQPVGFVTVLDSAMRASPEALFEGTPWEFFQSMAVFQETDTKEPPRIYFVYWGSLRADGDVKGSAATLEGKVKQSGAQLTYPVTLPIEGVQRGMPATAFATALQAQMTVPGSAASSSTSPSTPLVTPASSISSESGWGRGLLLLSLAGLAGYVTYRVVRKR